MPNRVLRDWTFSDKVETLTPTAEVFFVRLIMKADDYGRFYADPKRLRSACYPLKDSIRDTDISRWLAECEKAGLLRCYDATGCRYLRIERFDQRLRLKKERFPRPPNMPDACLSSDGHMTAPFVSVSDSQDSGKGDARGKGFPVTVDDALAQCDRTAVAKEFIMHCFDKGASRGGMDAQGIEIMNFSSYVLTQWKYEQDRLGREKTGPTGNSTRLGPTLAEVSALMKEKWGADSRCSHWAASFHGYWTKNKWRRHDKAIDWKVELSTQVSKWRTAA